MNELVEKITQEANITPQQAQQAIDTIAAYVKEKFPMLGGAVDNLFNASN